MGNSGNRLPLIATPTLLKQGGTFQAELEWLMRSPADGALRGRSNFGVVLPVALLLGLAVCLSGLSGTALGAEVCGTKLGLHTSHITGVGIALGDLVGRQLRGSFTAAPILRLVVVVLVQRAQSRLETGQRMAAPGRILTSSAALAFFLLSVDGISHVKHFTQVECSRRTEVHATIGRHRGRIQEAGAGGLIWRLVGASRVELWAILAGLAERRGQRGGVSRCCGLLVGLANPRVGKELLDGVSFLRVHGQQVRDQILGRLGDIVPPRREERVLSACHLLCQHLDTLVIEGRETAEKSVEHTAHGPHIHTLRIPFILDNLGRCVADSSARGHGLAVPDHLGQTKIGNFNGTNATGTDTGDKVSLVLFILVARLLGLRMCAGYKRRGIEEQVLGFDIAGVMSLARHKSKGFSAFLRRGMLVGHLPVNHARCFMQVFDGMGDLRDDMSTEILAEVCQSHDLVEELSTGAELQNNVIVLAGFGKVDQLDDVGVIQVAHDLDFFQNVCSL